MCFDLFAPYLLLNVCERGANAVLLALAPLLWVFWATHSCPLHPVSVAPVGPGFFPYCAPAGRLTLVATPEQTERRTRCACPISRSRYTHTLSTNSIPHAQVVTGGGTGITLQIETSVPLALRLPRVYFPTWEARVNAQRTLAYPSAPYGLATVDVPAGNSDVVVQFENTPLRRAAELVTLTCLILSIPGGTRKRLFRKLRLTGAILLAMLAVFSLFRVGSGGAVCQPTAYTANFQDEILLGGVPFRERHAACR